MLSSLFLIYCLLTASWNSDFQSHMGRLGCFFCAFVELKMDKFFRLLQEGTTYMQFARRQVLYLDLYLPCLLGYDASMC